MTNRPFTALRRVSSFVLRYAIKRVQLATPPAVAGGRPAVTYATFRTASTSIHHAIRASSRAAAVKAHALAPEHLMPLLSPHGRMPLTEKGLPIFGHVGNLAVRHAIILPRRDADFVVAVRDPIAVAASMMAAFRRWWPEGLVQRIHEPGFIESAGTLDLLEREFFGTFPRHMMLGWLSHDVVAGIGWDPFAHDFDREAGFTRHDHGPWRLLVLRTELPDEYKDTVLRDFLARPAIKIERTNDTIGFGPERRGLIRAVHRVIARNPAWIDSVADDPRARHFWPEASLEKLRAKWRAGPRD
jgi:hypothetical protein